MHSRDSLPPVIDDSFGGRIGLALGSGAARGWAHIGVIRALEQHGLHPEIVCGSSSGAVIGALYAAGRLDAFEEWGRSLDFRQVIGYLDVSLRGGLIRARKLFDAIEQALPDQPIESLDKPFAAVATDLETGREVWLRKGSVLDALRASMALPGFITPVRSDGRWLVDGGLVNPVPVSLCRAMGADTAIAVDLNTLLLRRRFGEALPSDTAPAPLLAADEPAEGEPAAAPGLRASVQEFVADLRRRMTSDDAPSRETPPSIYEVVANAVNIMQVRITRSRMAGDPPDLLVTPRLADFALLDFDRAAEAIEEGRRAVAQAIATARAAEGS